MNRTLLAPLTRRTRSALAPQKPSRFDYSASKQTGGRGLSVTAASVVMMLALWASPIDSVHAADSMPLLERLRANDARFSNVSLTFKHTTDHQVHPQKHDYERFGQTVPDHVEADFWQPRTIRVVYDSGLSVRGEDIVRSSTIDQQRSQQDRYVKFDTRYLGGQINGTVYELSDFGPGQPRLLTINPWKKGDFNAVNYDQWNVELAFGVGLGRRIMEVLASRQVADGREILGSIQLSRHDISSFTATLDEAGLVRRAEITTTFPSGAVREKIRIETSGTVEANGVRLAKFGSITKSGPIVNGQPESSTTERFEFSNAKFDLTAEEFSALYDFSVQPNMQVIDRVNDKHDK